MSTMSRPCPNVEMGPNDLEVGQIWHNYLTQHDRMGFYRIVYLSRTQFGPDMDLELCEDLPHGSGAHTTRINMEAGMMLAHWNRRKDLEDD